MTKELHLKFIIVFLIIMALWSDLIPSANPFGVYQGASVIWFIVLYLIGSYIRLYIDVMKYKFKALLLYISASAIVCLCWIILTILSKRISAISNVVNYYCRYNCIIVVVASVALFIMFLRIKIHNNILTKIIRFFAPLTLGVYLIHDNPNIRNILWNRIFTQGNLISNPLVVFQVILRMLIIFLCCSFVDYFRSILFIFEKSKIYSKFLEKLNFEITKDKDNK